MSDDIQISKAAIQVNNNTVLVKPNTISFTSGKGEQKQYPASAGGGQIRLIYSDDLETHIAMVKFSMHATAENIRLAEEWKGNANQNAVAIISDTFNVNIVSAALVNDYEANLTADGVLELEFAGTRAN